MKVIIASDIFGRTPQLEELACRISPNIDDMTIVDPYQGIDKQFIDEQTAYDYFQKNIGIEQYQKVILKIINQSSDNLILIGFSVGAAAIWNLSDKVINPEKMRAVCFYGSQIRYSTDINPDMKMTLIFPEHEPHFEVKNLISQLSQKKNVDCKTSPFLHGFMNKKSVNFNDNGYMQYLNFLKIRLLNPHLCL
jgi:dienelactone hydrolase